jgi:catechol 2,3-dioxygenase-like lactoylglutathione lyase family enzyme
MTSEPITPNQVAMPKSFLGVHHIKLPAHDLRKTYEFYTNNFPMTPLPHFDHIDKHGNLFAQLFRHEPTGTLIEIRQHRPQAAAQKGWDPITWSVQRVADLEAWGAFFDARDIKHSRVLRGVKGWVMGVEDPDGKIIRLYTEEEHEWTNSPDEGMLASLFDHCIARTNGVQMRTGWDLRRSKSAELGSFLTHVFRTTIDGARRSSDVDVPRYTKNGEAGLKAQCHGGLSIHDGQPLALINT